MDAPSVTGTVYRARVADTPLEIRLRLSGDHTRLYLTFEGRYGYQALQLSWYESYRDGREASAYASEGVSIIGMLEDVRVDTLLQDIRARIYIPYSERDPSFAVYSPDIWVSHEQFFPQVLYTALPFLSERNRQRRMRVQHLSSLDDFFDT